MHSQLGIKIGKNTKMSLDCNHPECPRSVVATLQENPRAVALAMGWQVEMQDGKPSLELDGTDYCPEHKEK